MHIVPVTLPAISYGPVDAAGDLGGIDQRALRGTAKLPVMHLAPIDAAAWLPFQQRRTRDASASCLVSVGANCSGEDVATRIVAYFSPMHVRADGKVSAIVNLPAGPATMCRWPAAANGIQLWQGPHVFIQIAHLCIPCLSVQKRGSGRCLIRRRERLARSRYGDA
jgi:hypothetical protein